MYQLYEKVPKNKEYIYGSKAIEQERNPFLEGPCLLCISAQNQLEKSVFGVTKEGMKMARLRVRNEPNAKYDLKNFPVKFLSIRLEKDERKLTEEQYTEIFIKQYLVPLISENGQRIELNKAMKNIRNVNIISYCDGTVFAKNIEDELLNQMKIFGYTDIESKKIISQMCMFPIATDQLEGNQKSTCISFKDINDLEVYDEINEEYEETVKESPIGESIIKLSDNELAYLVDGIGTHDLRRYSKEGKALPVSLSSVVSKALQNSIENSNNDEFVPVDIKILTEDLENIMNEAEKGKSVEELMQQLDENIEYHGARKLSDYEIELLDQLDDIYTDKIKNDKELASTKKAYLKQMEKLNATNDAIKRNCTDITVQKILIAQGYQVKNEEEILNLPSDKEIIKNNESLLMKQENTENKGVHEQKAEKLQNSVEQFKILNKQIQEINQDKGMINK